MVNASGDQCRDLVAGKDGFTIQQTQSVHFINPGFNAINQPFSQDLKTTADPYHRDPIMTLCNDTGTQSAVVEISEIPQRIFAARHNNEIR